MSDGTPHTPIGFDREKYIALQSQHIKARREDFGGKLYLEMGGKLFDDMHASRVLPVGVPASNFQGNSFQVASCS